MAPKRRPRKEPAPPALPRDGRKVPPPQPVGAPAAQAPAAYRRLLYMYGAVTQIELNGFLEGNSIDTEDRKREIKSKWREAAENFQDLVRAEAGLPDTVSARPLPKEATGFLDELQTSSAFKETFSNYPLSFEEVEIDKIVASQRTVHLDFVEQTKTKIDPGSAKDVLSFCLHTGQDKTPLNCGRTAQNAFTFTSPNPGLRFLGAFEQPYRADSMDNRQPGGQPVHSVLLLVGYGASTINVYRVGKRLILNNGFHRLVALRALRVSYAPVVVQQVTHPELELPQAIADLPRDYLVSSPRPALIKDFFDELLNCEVRQNNFLKSLQVGWGINESRVPL